MPRKRELFLDTNVLLGLTFYSDRWFQEARPAYENDHELHTSELVVYEYCCSPAPFREPPTDPSEKETNWNLDRGLVSRIRARIAKPYREFRTTIRHMPDEELTLERAITEFIDIFEIRDEAVPQIRSEFRKEFENKAVNSQYINEFASELVDKIIEGSKKMKKELAGEVELHDSKYHIADQTRQKWEDYPNNPPGEPDLSILIDATLVLSEYDVDTLLSGDSDLLAVQETAMSYFGFSILSIADEYSVGEQAHAN